MIVDLSHAGEQTTLEALEVSTKPTLITHSNCGAIVRHPRCVSDRVIKAIAKNGSVMGITGIRSFVSRRERVTIEQVLDHYDHVARLAGIEHVGVGSDTGLEGRDVPGRNRRPYFDIAGLNHPKRMFDLTEGLIRRGYSNRSIELVLGGNFERVLREACG
jgi:membrane dipeptidase